MLVHWIWLATRPSVSDRVKAALLERFGDPEDVFYADEQLYRRVDGLTEECIGALCDKNLRYAQQVLAECAGQDIHILTYRDAAYPARLKNISDPPLVLYYKGRLPDFDGQPLIGVVGMDIDFSMLHRLVSGISVYENSTAHLTDASAQIVHEHPDEHPDTLTMEASSALINGMNLVLCANFSDVIRESLPILAFSGVVFIVLTVVFIWYLIRKTRRITAPLKSLTTAVQQMVETQPKYEVVQG